MKTALLLLVLAILVPTAVPQTKTKPKAKPEKIAEQAAQQAADPWLALIDAGKYAQSWQTSAQFFQAHITQGQWQSAAAEARGPLGELKTRKLTSSKFSKSLPGMPDGKYVVLEYESTFAKKESAMEIVSSMEDKDGVWRVSGYFLR